MVLYIILGILILIAIYVVVTHNNLVNLRNKVNNEWSQIDIQLKRRFDLIPNLVETVKGYAKHEKETLDSVIKARNSYISASLPEDQMKANGELTNAISKIFALSEAYPDLKANTNFQNLQTTLKETEDKISYSRQFYNDSVMKLNNKIEMFPSNLIASRFKFEKRDFFEAVESERENVQVKF